MVKVEACGLQISWIACLALVLGSQSKAQIAPLTIRLIPLSRTVVKVIEKNNSLQDIFIPCNKPNMKFFVASKDGKAATETREGLRYEAAERGEISNSTTACVSGSLKAGATTSYPIDLAKYYDLDDSKTHTVRVEQNLERLPAIKSNSAVLPAK